MPHRDKEAYNKYMREWRARNKDERRSYAREYYEKNKAKWCSTPTILERNRNSSRRHRMRRKLELIAQYGGKCTCCGEVRPEFLSIDHINGDGAAERRAGLVSSHGDGLHRHLKKQGWPKDRYRLLCYNCNLARGFFGYCPHDKEKSLCA